MEDSYDTVLYKASHRSAVQMIFKTNFQGFSIRPIDMYDLSRKSIQQLDHKCMFKKNHNIVILYVFSKFGINYKCS